MFEKCRFIGYPKEIMGYFLNQPCDHKMFVARGAMFFFFLERKFLAGRNHGKNINLDETQSTNETTQDYEMKTKISFFNVLKLRQRSSPPKIVVQEPTIVQDQVNESILESIQQPMNPMHETSRKSIEVHRVPD